MGISGNLGIHLAEAGRREEAWPVLIKDHHEEPLCRHPSCYRCGPCPVRLPYGQ